MFQRQADAMIFDKNRLAKFYEQNTWENFTNVWEIFTNVWEIFTNVWEISINVWEVLTNAWEIFTNVFARRNLLGYPIVYSIELPCIVIENISYEKWIMIIEQKKTN